MRVFSLEKMSLFILVMTSQPPGRGVTTRISKYRSLFDWIYLPKLRIPSGENGGLEDGIPIQTKTLSYVILLLTVILEG